MKKYLQFSNRIYKLCEKIEKEDPELAKKLREHIDDIIKWYIMHGREMTLEEFHEVLGLK